MEAATAHPVVMFALLRRRVLGHPAGPVKEATAFARPCAAKEVSKGKSADREEILRRPRRIVTAPALLRCEATAWRSTLRERHRERGCNQAIWISPAGCGPGTNLPFEEFFAEYFPRIYRFARVRLGGDDEAAEEVAQTTLIRALAKMGTYRGEAALFTWLCAFSRHEISAWFERAGKAPRVSLADDSAETRAVLDAIAALSRDDPEQEYQRRELSRLVHATLDHLPGKVQRRAGVEVPRGQTRGGNRPSTWSWLQGGGIAVDKGPAGLSGGVRAHRGPSPPAASGDLNTGEQQ